MPILAPDRNKGKIAGIIMGNLRPSMADQMRMGAENNFARMNNNGAEHEAKEETDEAGAMALRAMMSAINDSDYEAAYRAYYNMHRICDAQLESEESEEPGEMEGY